MNSEPHKENMKGRNAECWQDKALAVDRSGTTCESADKAGGGVGKAEEGSDKAWQRCWQGW